MFKLSSLNFTLLDKYIQPSLTWKYIIATLVHRAKCSGFTITALKLWDDSLVVYRTFTLVKSVPFEGPKQNFSWGPHSFNMQKIKNIIFLFWPPGGPKQFAVRKQFAYASGRPWVKCTMQDFCQYFSLIKDFNISPIPFYCGLCSIMVLCLFVTWSQSCHWLDCHCK